MKKFLSNTIVQLLIAVIIGLLAGFVVNDAVLEVVICIKHITGQIIFFLVPLIILGFIAPSIAHLRSNASKMLLFAFGIAYLSSIGASFFGAAVGYNVIPFLHIADDANTLKALPENLLKTLNPQLHSRSATYIKRNGLLIRKITIKSSRPFQCAYHPLTP